MYRTEIGLLSSGPIYTVVTVLSKIRRRHKPTNRESAKRDVVGYPKKRPRKSATTPTRDLISHGDPLERYFLRFGGFTVTRVIVDKRSPGDVSRLKNPPSLRSILVLVQDSVRGLIATQSKDRLFGVWTGVRSWTFNRKSQEEPPSCLWFVTLLRTRSVS